MLIILSVFCISILYIKNCEKEYVFYIDGVETWRTKKGFANKPAHVIISDEIRGWNGDIADQDLPHYFYIDYVRVYDIRDTSLPKAK
jgi:hypothetical protein